MIQTPEERTEALNRLYEDVRRAMNNKEFDKAARLALKLTGELADDEFIRIQQYPICLECNGYAEVVDPEHPERKTMCSSAPKACPGNKHGRMSPEQYQAYLDAHLSPRKPTVTETVAKAGEDGSVPRLAPDDVKPTPPAYVYSREEVIALNPIREGQGLPPLPLPPESTPFVQS